MLTRRSFLMSAALLAICSRTVLPAAAQGSDSGARTFIETLGNEAIATFANKGLSREQATERFRAMLHKGFDVPYIGRWVLGRFWTQASPQQQQEYQSLFERMIVDTYANRFLEYSGETFRVMGARAEGETDSMVQSQIVRQNGPPVNVEWRVRRRDGGFKIIDVVVEGVSMGVTQRSEFASVIQSTGGVDGLIRALKTKVGA